MLDIGAKFGVSPTSVTSGTAAQLAASTTLIPNNVLCYETDTDKAKLGDGTKTYTQLAYLTPTSGGSNSPSRNMRTYTAYDAITAGQWVALRDATSVETITADKNNARSWIGAARTSASAGNTVEVDILGGVNEFQLGLTSGEIYYLGDNGALTTTVNSREVGRALSASRILIRGTGAFATSYAPARPTITSPGNGSVNVSLTPTFTGSSFAPNGVADTHAVSQWQVSTSSSFATMLHDSGEVANLVSYPLPVSVTLTAGTSYYVRVRYKGIDTGWSPWSEASLFVTVAVTGNYLWDVPGTYTFTVPTGVTSGKAIVIPDETTSQFGNILVANQPYWEQLADIGAPIRNVPGVAVDKLGRICVAGGVTSSGVTNRVDRYDPVSGTWSTLPSMQTARALFALLVDSQNRLYALGGISSVAMNPPATTPTLERYDPNTNTWTLLSYLPTNRNYRNAAAIYNDQYIITVGGLSNQLSDGSAAARYNIATNTWTTIANPLASINPSYTHMDSTMQVGPDGRLYVIGGFISGGTSPHTKCVFAYTVDTNTWVEVASLNYSRSHLTSAVDSQGRIYALGGSGDLNAARYIERYDHVTNTWSVVGTTPATMGSRFLSVFSGSKLYTVGQDDTTRNKFFMRDFAATSSVTGADSVLSGDSFAISNGQISSPGNYGTTSKVATMKNNIALTPGSTHTVVVGSAKGAVYVEWGTGNSGRVLFGTPGSHTFTAPDGVTSARVTVVPDSTSSSFSDIVSGSGPSATWTFATPMPEARYHHSTSIDLNGNIYVIGGIMSGSPVNTVIRYNPNSNTWTTVAPIPLPVFAHRSATDIQGRVYVTGGTREGGAALAEVRRYNPSTDTWETLPYLQNARYNHSVAVDTQGRVCVIGGTNGAGVLNSLERYDPVTGEWTNLPTDIVHRSVHSSAVDLQGRIYVIGGYANVVVSNVDRYDPSTNTWTTVAPLVTPRMQHTSATDAQGRIYVIGGSGLGGRLSSVDRYDPSTDTWVSVPSMSVDRHEHTSVVDAHGRIYAIGGVINSGNVPSNSVERYDPNATITGHDVIHTGSSFSLASYPPTSPGSYGINSGTAGTKLVVPLTTGQQYPVTVGSTNGAVLVEWGPEINPTGEAVFTTPGTYNWTVPAGVASVSVVAVGAGGSGGIDGGGGGGLCWGNSVAVVPGSVIQVSVGVYGGGTGSNPSHFNNTIIARNGGNGSGQQGQGGGRTGGNGGGSGGGGGSGLFGGGGGAGGYSGNGGGGGGSRSGAMSGGGRGGGVGIYGQGPSGRGGTGGAGGGGGGGGGESYTYGAPGEHGSPNPDGTAYGGGGGGANGGRGMSGAVRIIWGPGRSFPNNAA